MMFIKLGWRIYVWSAGFLKERRLLILARTLRMYIELSPWSVKSNKCTLDHVRTCGCDP